MDTNVPDPEKRATGPESTPSLQADAARGGAESLLAIRDSFEASLRHGGLIAGLAMLNERTRFRFTGLYRVVPPRLYNVALYDRENPALRISGAVCALTDSYCSIVHEGGRTFHVSDAQTEVRLHAHPARDSVLSYAGAPVRLPGGRVVGTLCHFDGRPRIMPDSELTVLQEVAPLLITWLRDDVDA